MVIIYVLSRFHIVYWLKDKNWIISLNDFCSVMQDFDKGIDFRRIRLKDVEPLLLKNFSKITFFDCIIER